ncbi:hypothetical protein NPIL_471061 [Nephila pilipes]|uniref:Uncharacterized protein n=1 Tax=Nephila pilipes TaxID=299642 RepID=A0A8X6QXK9_NEPPI|nr:hypothetical protein NPIL_471061 [Nephila pilipes]
MDPADIRFILRFEVYLQNINEFLEEMRLAQSRLTLKIEILHLMPCLTFSNACEALGYSTTESVRICISYVCNIIEEWINFFTCCDRFARIRVLAQRIHDTLSEFENVARAVLDLAMQFDAINNSRREALAADL